MDDRITIAERMDLAASTRYTTEELVTLDTITREAIGKPLARCTNADLDAALAWVKHLTADDVSDELRALHDAAQRTSSEGWGTTPSPHGSERSRHSARRESHFLFRGLSARPLGGKT